MMIPNSSDFESKLRRKIQTREKTIFFMGNEELLEKHSYFGKPPEDSDHSTSKSKQQYWLNLANDSWNVTNHSSIISKRKSTGRLVVFTKKALRKVLHALLGWYITPIIDQQNRFNSIVVNTLNSNREYLNEELVKIVNTLNSNREYLNEELVKIVDAQKSIQGNICDVFSKADRKLERLLGINKIHCDPDLLINATIDYFAFEDRFRGSRDRILTSNRLYVDFFKSGSEGIVLDIGCGRGEFMEAMGYNGIHSIGIDLYQPFVDFCNARGLNAVQADAITYLLELEDDSLNGIFMAHVVEHLPTDYLITLIGIARKKLKQGCPFVLETPNPETLTVFSSFYLDLDHLRPVPFHVLDFLFKEAGYASIERLHNPISDSERHFSAPNVPTIGPTEQAKLEQGVGLLNELLCGYRDYTLIARK